ncbi:hypothetical protein [Massilia varians]|jgi:hypothetical protein|uniref:hypothetical protein n=1 Tax=Massilia varians TaxID=457921 RepID=UPI0025530163|nr:hypothetical protein [Massilia varians]MDK6079787.1 hypothetical protein [Massilia varians]
MNKSTISEALAEMRIRHRHIAAMIRETAVFLGDDRLDDRLRGEPGFHIKAVELTQALVIAMTLAQTLKPEEKFANLMGPERFSGGDSCLEKLGTAMLENMVQSPRLAENLVSDDMLRERARAIQLWM